MLLAIAIYIAVATIYYTVITIAARRDAESRRRRFPRYKNIYTVDHKSLTTRAIIFPYDIVRRGYTYAKWLLTSKY